jgi:hypothetical protein
LKQYNSVMDMDELGEHEQEGDNTQFIK